MFDTLPYPNVGYGADGQDISHALSTTTEAVSLAPRTMPSFACCAMQSSYAMLMLSYRSRDFQEQAEGVGQLLGSDDLADELYWGLTCVIQAVSNYATAFEALGGMKRQLRTKLYLSIDC
jgi:hypothetical protein